MQDLLKRLEIIFLAGRQGGLSVAGRLDCPIWSLPVGHGVVLLEAWAATINKAIASCPWVSLGNTVVLVSDWRGKVLDSGPGHGVQISADSRDHRGSGGVVSDELRRLGSPADAVVLLVEISASPAVDLSSLFRVGVASSGSCDRICVGESRLGRYCGVSLLPRRVFELSPKIGFVDFKEQLIPMAMSKGIALEACKIANRAIRLRSREDWLDVVSSCAGEVGLGGLASSVKGDACFRFNGACAVARGARIGQATLVSSVVMEGAEIGDGAIVARSVIGPGARVPPHARVIDSLVSGRGGHQGARKGADLVPETRGGKHADLFRRAFDD